jgi:hypothetical protein
VAPLGNQAANRENKPHPVARGASSLLENLNRSSEKIEFWVWADPFREGAGHAGGALKTSANCPPGVADSIELHNGRQVTRRATKGSWGGA